MEGLAFEMPGCAFLFAAALPGMVTTAAFVRSRFLVCEAKLPCSVSLAPFDEAQA